MNTKKLGVVLILVLLLCGCQPAETTSSDIPVASPTQASEVSETGNANDELSESFSPSETADIIEESEEDTLAIKKLLALCAFPDDNKSLKEEFLALVKEVKIEGEKYILTVDKIEATNNVDIKDDFYTNTEVKNEEYVIHINSGGANVAIVVDPHNNFRAVTLDGLKEYVKGIEDAFPFYFYSLDGELVLLLEMMLP